MWLSGIIKRHINMHAATQRSAVRAKHAGALPRAAIGLMKVRRMLSARWAAVLLIAVCPLLLIMMGCILENLQGIDFIWKDYLLSLSLEGRCV